MALTMAQARARAELVTVQEYHLDVDLTGDEQSFHSTTTVRFSGVAGAQTFVEVRPRRLRSARLNGEPLDPTTLAGGRLPLPHLRPDNLLEVTAEFDYSHASEGMHRFVDPADGEVYVYAQPSIAAAPRFMACFDQPDLKAPVRLAVTADPGWQVLGNAEGKQVAPGRWEFGATPPLATYLITLAAGPYQSVTGDHDGIPLGVHARGSLADELAAEAPEVMEITAAGLDRYHELFGIRYPYGTYDQVFAPEFSWGAMEFPGCVLIRDELMFRSAATEGQRERRAVLLAHEMAHMWFGNLVTMRWWDDLWLNESFADYLGWRVVAEATRWRTAWTSYSVQRKSWGMEADQRPSTHPVAAAEVPDTAAALTNFDGISYAKGSAVLRQLVAWLGDDVFLAGLRDYFHRHAHGNATLADLLAALSRASGRELTDWARVWLREPGIGTLRPRLRVGPDGRYESVAICQQPAAGTSPRPYRIGVGVYQSAPDGTLRQRTRVEVDLDPAADGGLTAVPELTGQPAGELLLVNDGDLGYAKLRLDADPRALGRLADPLARAVGWGAWWDACRDAELPPGQLLTAAVAALPAETQQPTFEAVLAALFNPLTACYLAPEQRPPAYAAIADACRRVLQRAEPGSGWQLAAARGLIGAATEPDLPWLRQWLAGDAPAGLAVDADLRWSLLLRLAAMGAIGERQIEAEAARDRTARGVQEATRCRAAQPDPRAKRLAWQLITADRELSNRVVAAAAEGFWQPEQVELTADYVPRFFEEINRTAGWRSQQMLTAITRAAYPRYAVAPATLRLARARLTAGDELHPAVRREIADATDDLRRALSVRGAGGEPR